MQTARACYSDTALVLFGHRSQVRKAKSDMTEVERPRSRGATIQDIRRWVRPWIPDTLAGIPWAVLERFRVAAFRSRVVTHRYCGHALSLYINDPTARDWYDRDWLEIPELEALRRTALRPGGVVFNIGAHQGVYALIFAADVGTRGKVVAVEAHPHNVAVARRNRELNEAKALEIVHAAAMDRSGTVHFSSRFNGQIQHSGGMQVPAITVDALSERHGIPDLLFIDVEGAECLVLRGATKTLQRGPDCFVEVHVGMGLESLGGSIGEVLSFFPPSQYEVRISGESPRSFRPPELDDPLFRDRFFLLATRKHSAGS